MEIDLKRLNQILTVTRTGSFSRAAEELHISQPALSRSIASLEERYGIRIFERGRSGAVLTPVGRLAVEEAEALLRKARTVEHNFRLYGTGDSGRLAFGMGPLIASMILPSLSIRFLRERATLHLRSVVKAADALYQELMNDNIELLFTAGGQLAGEADIVSEVVGKVSRSVLVRAGHPLADQRNVRPQDIALYPLLSAVDSGERQRQRHVGSFICDNYHVLRETVLQTDAVWMSSVQMVPADIASGRMVELAMVDEGIDAEPAVEMITRSGSVLSPAARAVKEYVGEFLAVSS